MQIDDTAPTKAGALDMMVRKLGSHADLTERDRQALLDLPNVIRSRPAGSMLIREGDRPSDHAVLLSGYTCRHKMTSLGGRQIVSVQLPGEALSCSSLFFDTADHTTQALTKVELACIPRAAFRDVARNSAAIGHALLLMTLIEASVSNEWLLNLGRRTARARVAHLLCEFAARLEAAGLSDGSDYDWPLTQEQMGDALGLTAVHVNRMMAELRGDGLVVQSNRQMSIPRRRELERAADFSPDYLRTAQPKGVDQARVR